MSNDLTQSCNNRSHVKHLNISAANLVPLRILREGRERAEEDTRKRVKLKKMHVNYKPKHPQPETNNGLYSYRVLFNCINTPQSC